MTSLTEFFNKHEDDALKGISHKNSIIKRNIIAHMAVNGECTLSELTKQLHISVPTITKLVQELVEENIVTDNGKVETPGGRRPNIYGLANSAIYFVGVNVGRDFMGYVVTDLQNNIILEQMDPTFELLDRPQCLDRICTNIEEFVSSCGVDRGKILGLGVCMTGRVNPTTGRSYKYFTSSEESMRQGEGRERHALPASGPRYRHRHRHGGQTLLRQERLRGRIRPHPLLRQREDLRLRQERLPGNRGVGYRHRGENLLAHREGRQHHPARKVRPQGADPH